MHAERSIARHLQKIEARFYRAGSTTGRAGNTFPPSLGISQLFGLYSFKDPQSSRSIELDRRTYERAKDVGAVARGRENSGRQNPARLEKGRVARLHGQFGHSGSGCKKQPCQTMKRSNVHITGFGQHVGRFIMLVPN